MSILKNNITAKRMALVAAVGEVVFHIGDLANLWGMTNLQNLRMTMKRYTDSGAFYRIQRGFYSLIPPEKIDPVLLGKKALHRYCYLSMESILFREGYRSQPSTYYTFLSDESKKFHLAGQDFLSRQLAPQYLYHPAGIVLKNGIHIATVERAIADMLYYNPRYVFDRPIDWEKIKMIQKELGYALTPHQYDTSKTP